MKNSYTKERKETNPHIPKPQRRRNPIDVESSQVAQSQVVDPILAHQYDEGYNTMQQDYHPEEEDPFYQPEEDEAEEDEDEAEGEGESKPERHGHDDEGHDVPIVGLPFLRCCFVLDHAPLLIETCQLAVQQD